MDNPVVKAFDYSNFPESRRKYLESTVNGEDFRDELKNELIKTPEAQMKYKFDSSYTAIGYSRVIVTFNIGKELFDKFFNSPAGIRGAFYAAVNIGELYQKDIIESLYSDKLVPYIKSSEKNENNLSLALDSFKDCKGKVWMDESEGEPGTDKENDIIFTVSRWKNNTSQDEAQKLSPKLKISTMNIMSRAQLGSYGPYRSRIKLLGAFVNASGEIYTAPNKITRSEQIHYLGFS